MKLLSATTREALADPATQIATCLKITRTDGIIIRLTDFDQPLVVGGHTYLPNGSTERSAVALSDGLSADNLSVRGVLRLGQVEEADLQNGRYDYALVDIFLAFANGAAADPIPLASGRFGVPTIDNGAYSVDLNGLTYALSASIGEITTPTCRAMFGDARCGIDLAAWQHDYTLAAVSDSRVLALVGPSALPSSATYAQGLVQVLTGPAAGLAMEVRSVTGLAHTLYLPLAISPQAGDTVRCTAGCDKSRSTCHTVFGNAINFQGEPDLPGTDSLFAPDVA
nr:DUF2163 domain-containing protein [uncultured Albidiferax sp.]